MAFSDFVIVKAESDELIKEKNMNKKPVYKDGETDDVDEVDDIDDLDEF